MGFAEEDDTAQHRSHCGMSLVDLRQSDDGADARPAGPPKAEAEALASARGARSAPP